MSKARDLLNEADFDDEDMGLLQSAEQVQKASAYARADKARKAQEKVIRVAALAKEAAEIARDKAKEAAENRKNKIGVKGTKVNTSPGGGHISVDLYGTKIVDVSPEKIILFHGGYTTVSLLALLKTVDKMNQASQQYGLGYKVGISNGHMYAEYKGQGPLWFHSQKLELDR